MLLSEVAELIGAEPLGNPAPWRGIEIAACFAADLMSEVLAFCSPGALLLTGLANIQSVHTADVAELPAIVFVNDKRPSPQVLDLAAARGIPVFATPLTLYAACGLLYARGLAPSVKG
jgi:hypothetical protein